MNKRIVLLNGLAILAVIFNHTTSWCFTAMFWWTDRYLPVTVPNFDQVGSFHYYVLLVIRQLPLFAVPAFIFVSGFFISYACRGEKSTLTRKMIVTRILNLLIPYLIWMVVIFIGDVLQGNIQSVGDYFLLRGYYFVPLMCQFYLLSPLVVPWAKAKPRQILLISALLQWGTMVLWYIGIFWKIPVMGIAMRLTPYWLFFRWIFFFAAGIVAGFHLREVGEWLALHKKLLLIILVVLAFLAVLEPELLYRINETEWRGSSLTISTSLYALVFIFYFLGSDIPKPLFKPLRYLAGNTYGIYLTHDRVMEFVARVIRQLAPWMLSMQLLLFAPLIFLFGLGVPLLLIMVVRKSPLRKFSKYLLG